MEFRKIKECVSEIYKGKKEDKFIFINQDNITHNGLNLFNKNYILFKRHYYDKTKLLIATKGKKKGLVTLSYGLPKKVSYSEDLIILEAKKQEDIYFMYLYFNSPLWRMKLKKITKPILDISDIEELEIPLIFFKQDFISTLKSFAIMNALYRKSLKASKFKNYLEKDMYLSSSKLFKNKINKKASSLVYRK